MKIKFLIILIILIINFQQTTATTVELTSDKENYKVGETVHITLNLTPSGLVTGSVTIYEIITETKSKEYWRLFGTVSCAACAGGGIESIDEPYHRTFSMEVNDPGNYFVEANFGEIEKTVFFNVSGDEEKNITVNETITIEINGTENITEIDAVENLTNRLEIENNKTEIDNNDKIENNISKLVKDVNKTEKTATEEPTEEEKFKFNYFMISLIIILLVLVVGACLAILVLVRRR